MVPHKLPCDSDFTGQWEIISLQSPFSVQQLVVSIWSLSVEQQFSTEGDLA